MRRPPLRPRAGARVTEHPLAAKPVIDAWIGTGRKALSPSAASAMRWEENRVTLKPVLIDALRRLNMQSVRQPPANL